MPNVGIHFMLASRVLERWAARPFEAPFQQNDRAARSAFLHGAVAPDLGYFPSGDRLFSELVHLVRSADFARTLLAGAESGSQVAYAWGWATHVLADAAIHPLINRAAHDLIVMQERAGARPPSPAHAHMRVEYGLDAALYGRHPEIEELRFTHPIDAATASLVARTFVSLYELPIDEVRLLRSHGISARVSRAGLLYDRTMTAPFRRRPVHALARVLLRGARLPVRILPRVIDRSPLLGAVLDPSPPPPWLISEVELAASGFAERFAAHCMRRLDDLENCDLVLGGVCDPSRPSPRTLLALEELARRRAGAGA